MKKKKKSPNPKEKQSRPSEEKTAPELFASVPDTHVPKDTKTGEEVLKEPTKRITLDIPQSMHKAIKRKLVEKDMSMKDYFLGMAAKDLQLP